VENIVIALEDALLSKQDIYLLQVSKKHLKSIQKGEPRQTDTSAHSVRLPPGCCESSE
jgi:hypothetical protein